MNRTHRSLPLFVVLAALAIPAVGSAYVLCGYRWSTQQVPYYINPANADVSASAAIAALQAGAGTWAAQSNANISLYYMGQTTGSTIQQNGKNEVFFRNGSNGSLVAETMRWYDGSGHIIDADIVFYDAAWKFFTGTSGCSGGVYIEDFAAHEFGHMLGLRHSTVSSATMYPTGTNCSTSWRTLDADDLAGIEAIYPPSSASTTTTNTSPTVTISSPASSITITQGTAITFGGAATDKEDGTISSRLSWTSSIDGALGTGSSVVRTLSAGAHTITASVSDSGGLSASKTVAVTVATTTTTTTTTTTLPSGWQTSNIGATSGGSAGENSGVFTVSGGGADIWGTADAFRYVYRPLAGDGTIIARVASVQNVNPWTKAGVMIRQTLGATSAHASMFVTPGKGLAFQARAVAGGISVSTGVAGAAPRWVRLVRAGQTVTASVSTDGSAWTYVGRQTIALSGAVYVGLAVSSHSAGVLASATFDHVVQTP